MQNLNSLLNRLNKTLKLYLDVAINGRKLAYFYWDSYFFKDILKLKFEPLTLSNEIKAEINTIGKSYFNKQSKDIKFKISYSLYRTNIEISGIKSLIKESEIKNQTSGFDYIYEYVLYDILYLIEKEKRVNNISDITKYKKKQLANFLITYIEYLTTNQQRTILNNLKYEKEFNTNRYTKKQYKNKITFIKAEKDIDSKKELMRILELMGNENENLYFRGQSNSTWQLGAALFRNKRYVEYEKEMYYEILSLKPESFYKDENVYERLTTMQHYGMPTRLLDITRNPLIALYFACEEESDITTKGCDGRIFIFQPISENIYNFADKELQQLEQLFNKNYDDNNDSFIKKNCFIKGIAKNQRISNQCGDFIFVGKNANKHLQELPKKTIIIDSKLKSKLMKQLQELNIHAGTVYPDLSHMNDYIKSKYKNKNRKRNNNIDSKQDSEVNSNRINILDYIKQKDINILYTKFERTKKYPLRSEIRKVLINQDNSIIEINKHIDTIIKQLSIDFKTFNPEHHD